MKKITAFLCASILAMSLFSQDFDDSLFSDDDFFFEDDGIINLEQDAGSSGQTDSSNPFSVQNGKGIGGNEALDMSHGSLFQNGSVKIGGRFDTSIATSTSVYQDGKDFDFAESVKNTTLTPEASALLSIDARPGQTLRMYAKFGMGYPYVSKANSTAQTERTENPFTKQEIYKTDVKTTVKDYLSVKELFTDFSVQDRVFFRFGLHTVTWGTGYFFSPVSDIINTSSINPENTGAQVDGCFNLRTQITFPGTQNCLWFYAVPSTDFKTANNAETYAKDTALAGKADIVLGNWEVGLGGYFKRNNAPKAIFTASGGFKKVSIFGEALYQYGADSQWQKNSDWNDKTNIFQATVGASYYWKTPQINLAAQYYYDSNDQDMKNRYATKGHNIAAVASFGRIFGTTDFSATIFTMANFGKEELDEFMKTMLANMGISTSFLSSMTVSAMMTYSPTKEMSFSFGPYFTWQSLEGKPDAALNITAKLGGGKF